MPNARHKPVLLKRVFNLPKSGKLFLLVIILILAPGYWLSVSLMFLIAAMFLGIFIYNLLIAHLNLRRLEPRAAAAPELYANIPAAYEFSLANRHRFMRANHLAITLDSRDLDADGLLLETLPASSAETIRLRVTAKKRGWAKINGIRVQTGYPFGLVRSGLVFLTKRRLLVFPALLDALPNPLAAERLTRGYMPRSTDDYQYLVSYQAGDDVRQIHWRKSALLENPVIKKDLLHAEVVEPRLFVPDPCSHFEYAVSAMTTYFHDTESCPGWSMVTPKGIRDMANRDDMLKHLALVKPLEWVEKPDFEGRGYRAIFASSLVPPD